MYVKSIVLDGFKSYGNRVEITGFDPEFNAITGLNGTGKSNILDSICFVLGITNLSNVRAGSLQELIYKHGQAGITKATVSITFDNRDKRQCPIGYENHDEITVTRQVVMGGKNKYLINGINVQNKRVSDLFCSVQLNVNNPHFLIMQGRITKVLNMKPPEILSMVEEAAGTRMYEAKKQAAQKTIEKKDAKLRELNDIIKEDIAPKLQKLQDERSQFQEYQKVVRELDNLTRLYVAYQYVTAEENASQSEAKVSQVMDEIQQKKDKIKDNKDEMKQLDQQVTELNNKLDEESGSVLQSLQSAVPPLEAEEARLAAAVSSARDALLTHEKRARLVEQALREDRAAVRAKEEILREASSTFDSLQSAVAESETALASARAKFVSISAGLEGGDCSLQQQLIDAKQEISEASTSISQSTMEKKHLEQRLKTLEKEFNSSSGQFQQDQQNISKQQAELDKLKSSMSACTYSSSSHSALQQQHRKLQVDQRAVRDQHNQLSDRLQRTQFHYRDPVTGFDRRKVSGMVCRLITVNDPVYCTALETAAGGRLYNVVVDSEVTSKQLLQRGKLQSRTTIIPLNKITAHVIDRRTVQQAQEIGGGADKVQLALDLISYPEQVAPAMRWVFGQTLVCADLDTARRVTYDPRVRRRAVTLDGDVFDPAGTLSGGARAKGGSVLLQLQQLQQLEATLQQGEVQLQQLDAELRALSLLSDNYQNMQQKVEMTSHSLEVLTRRVASTAHAQLHTEIVALKEQADTLQQLVLQQRERQTSATERARELEIKLKDIKGHRDREFKKAEEELSAASSAAAAAAAAWGAREHEAAALRLELGELQAAVRAAEEQLTCTVRAAGDLREEVAGQEALLAEKQAEVKELQGRIKKQKAEIARRSGDISRLLAKKESLNKQNNELELKIKELDYNIKELQQEAQECAKKITALETEHNWILSERQYFGLAGGIYEFSRHSSLAPRLQQLTHRRDKLARGLNARAHTLLGKEEEQYQDVMRKKQIVEADRAKLVQVMSELDEKKKKTLVAACHQVNRDFASIFSSLLPGAQARLDPPPGHTVLDGLEVKVGFNQTWKESLGELSGGQRSLVALSLVLAMLLFKPAPLYILDEVDAALDLSHTQNIGIMLKEHFTASQFIIVSLKDGMFNNANVLFRTRFVDGMSSVQRTVNRR